MILLVCTSTGRFLHTDENLPKWREEHEIHFNHSPKKPDAIIGVSISGMGETLDAMKAWPDVPLFCYNWDCYSWAWVRPRRKEYDYHLYGEMLKKCREVWVPSVCTGRQTSLWWGVDNWHVILSSAPFWEHDNVGDDGYAFCSLREVPDLWYGMFERACEELGIPYKTTDHAVSKDDYRNLLARCRFIVSHYREASTGGLSLLEAYYLGKPCLISDSEWNGAKDYFGNRAMYFHGKSYDDFKYALQQMHLYSVKVPSDHRTWCLANYHEDRMFNDMVDRIHANT